MLCRLVVPFWVLACAVFMLMDGRAETLPPKTVLAVAARLPVDLEWVLASVVAIEFVAVAVMLAMAHLARPVAAGILAVFCLVLTAELIRGNASTCGCLGSKSPPTWPVLGFNGLLLLGVLAMDPTSVTRARTGNAPALAAIVLSAAGIAASFGMLTEPGRDVVARLMETEASAAASPSHHPPQVQPPPRD